MVKMLDSLIDLINRRKKNEIVIRSNRMKDLINKYFIERRNLKIRIIANKLLADSWTYEKMKIEVRSLLDIYQFEYDFLLNKLEQKYVSFKKIPVLDSRIPFINSKIDQLLIEGITNPKEEALIQICILLAIYEYLYGLKVVSQNELFSDVCNLLDLKLNDNYSKTVFSKSRKKIEVYLNSNLILFNIFDSIKIDKKSNMKFFTDRFEERTELFFTKLIKRIERFVRESIILIPKCLSEDNYQNHLTDLMEKSFPFLMDCLDTKTMKMSKNSYIVGKTGLSRKNFKKMRKDSKLLLFREYCISESSFRYLIQLSNFAKLRNVIFNPYYWNCFYGSIFSPINSSKVRKLWERMIESRNTIEHSQIYYSKSLSDIMESLWVFSKIAIEEINYLKFIKENLPISSIIGSIDWILTEKQTKTLIS